jgi:hypothetical protein
MSQYPADIRVNAAFPFPTIVQGTGPISVSKKNGLWTVGYDISRFQIRAPQPNDYMLVWDSVANVFVAIPLSTVT